MPGPELIRRNFRQYDRDNKQTGMVAPNSNAWNNSLVALTASRAYFARFVPSRSMTITQLAFSVTTAAGSDDACDVGIYDSTLTKIVTAGATTGKLNGTGVKTVPITPTTLQAGQVYYAAFSVGTFGTTGATLVLTNFSAGINILFGTATGVAEGLFFTSGHPLPAGTVTPTGNTVSVVVLGVRES